MRISLVFVFDLIVAIYCSQSIFAQDKEKVITYTVRVESVNPEIVHVKFSSAYAYSNFNKPSHLDYFIEEKTPFEMKVSGVDFLGMFQCVVPDGKIKVSLTQFVNGFKSAETEGVGQFNILHAGLSGVGYGWPKTFSNLSNITHPNRINKK